MEHPTHSHPLPHPPPPSPCSPTTSHPSPASFVPRPPSSSPQPTSQEISLGSTSRQIRRLHIRNARFNAPLLPPRRISPLFGLTPNAADPADQQDADCRPTTNEKCSSDALTVRRQSPLNILQEIQNSAKRKRGSPRPGLAGIFQDDSSMDENASRMPTTSWYNEKSNDCSPVIVRGTPSRMGMREIALNTKLSTPIRSPSNKSHQDRNELLADRKSETIEQARYIEHLESQLASALAKIDALTSPKSSKARSTKLRALTLENRNLRGENAGWAKKAEELVEQERTLHSAIETELRSQIEEWQETIDMKDARLAEMEWEMESLNIRIKQADGLIEANANLEKRIDVLSSMLVNSPERSIARSTTTSPRKLGPSKHTPRPISMVDRIPVTSSPRLRHSMTFTSEAALWDSRSISVSSIVETPECIAPDASGLGISASPKDEGSRSSGFFSRFHESTSAEDPSHDSGSFRSAPSSSSRPTSFLSTSSTGAPPWGVPSNSRTESRVGHRQKKMRRFPSGSSSLKPLILPTATTVPSLPASAPLFPSIRSVAEGENSNSSVDPMAAAFLTRLADGQSDNTPTASFRHTSPTWVQEQTLRALEGKQSPRRTDEQRRNASPIETSQEYTMTENGHVSQSASCRQQRPQSLREELEDAEMTQLRTDTRGHHDQDVFVEPAASVREQSTMPGFSSRPVNRLSVHGRSDATPKARQKPRARPPPVPSFKAQASQPAADSTHAEGLFSRLTSVVAQTRQDPVTLARRIVHNAWHLGSSSLGGIAWWLVGPLHHHHQHHQHHQQRQTRAWNARDVGPPAGDRAHGDSWPHFTGPNGPRLPQYRDYGATWMTPTRKPGDRRVPPILSSARKEPHLFPCDECQEPASRRTIRMWFHFCLTIVLAVGMAVKHGPAVLIAEMPSDQGSAEEPTRFDYNDQGPDLDPDRMTVKATRNADEDATIRVESPASSRGYRHHRGMVMSGGGLYSGYGSVALSDPAASSLGQQCDMDLEAG